jgi:hypothetical protein
MATPEQRVTRVFTGEDGSSRFGDLQLPLDEELRAGPNVAPLAMASLARVFGVLESAMLIAGEASWAGDAPHPAPARLFWAILAGDFQITVTDGATRRFPTGAFALIEDTTGAGHSSRILNDGALALVLRLAA